MQAAVLSCKVVHHPIRNPILHSFIFVPSFQEKMPSLRPIVDWIICFIEARIPADIRGLLFAQAKAMRLHA
ncbi:MAG: hypothetical protein B6D35_10765 [Candidatus Brocadia sp. UTAMX2]|nr:MAG: hypothetical protein B6D35_10765 [Candidatus Brocadia sp. UTAMX2]